MADTSPFAADDAPPPTPNRRRRRPWWRWNVVTLALALLAIVYVREFMQLSPGMTWLLAITVFLLWGLGPALVVPTFATTLREDADPPAGKPPTASGWWRRNGPVAVVRGIALVGVVLSLMHLGQVIFWAYSYQNWGPRAGVMLRSGYGPLLELFGAALLFLLAEIALRLDRTER